jgi:hypothetical protein
MVATRRLHHGNNSVIIALCIRFAKSQFIIILISGKNLQYGLIIKMLKQFNFDFQDYFRQEIEIAY